MEPGISHGFEDESLAAKSEWFAALSVAERLSVLDEYYELAVALNPGLRGGRDADPAEGSVLVLTLEDLIASKKAAGRPHDLEDVAALESLRRKAP